MMHNRAQQGFAALEAILIVVVLAVIGGAGYFVLHNRQHTKDDSSQNAANTRQSLGQLISTLKNDALALSAKVQLTAKDNQTGAAVVMYKAPGASWYALDYPDAATSAYFDVKGSDKKVSADLRKLIASKATANSFTKDTSLPPAWWKAIGDDQKFDEAYSNGVYLCTISNSLSVSAKTITFGCKTKADLMTQASRLAPFAEAYLATKVGTEYKDLLGLFAPPYIHASKNAGYSYASVNLPVQGNLLFSRQGSGDWHFVTKTSEGLYCTVLKKQSNEAQMALSGQCLQDDEGV